VLTPHATSLQPKIIRLAQLGEKMGSPDGYSVLRRCVAHLSDLRSLARIVVTLLGNGTSLVQAGMKRTVQVNVKMTEEDFTMLRKAAEKKWPDAVMTNSGIGLALARIAAREILGRKAR